MSSNVCFQLDAEFEEPPRYTIVPFLEVLFKKKKKKSSDLIIKVLAAASLSGGIRGDFGFILCEIFCYFPKSHNEHL